MQHATIENCLADTSELSVNARTQLANYLRGFHAPAVREGRNGINCPGCDRLLVGDGLVSTMLLSTFQWGIAHGEGFCSECGWPVRMYHSVELDGETKRFEYPLAHRCYTDDLHEVEVDPAEKYREQHEAMA